jgi:hypothetical protein
MPPGHLLGYPGRLVFGEVVQDQDLEGPLAEEGGEGAPQVFRLVPGGDQDGGRGPFWRGGRAEAGKAEEVIEEGEPPHEEEEKDPKKKSPSAKKPHQGA